MIETIEQALEFLGRRGWQRSEEQADRLDLYIDGDLVDCTWSDDSDIILFAQDEQAKVIRDATPELLIAARLAYGLLASRDTGGIIEGIAINALQNAIKKAEAAQ